MIYSRDTFPYYDLVELCSEVVLPQSKVQFRFDSRGFPITKENECEAFALIGSDGEQHRRVKVALNSIVPQALIDMVLSYMHRTISLSYFPFLKSQLELPDTEEIPVTTAVILTDDRDQQLAGRTKLKIIPTENVEVRVLGQKITPWSRPLVITISGKMERNCTSVFLTTPDVVIPTENPEEANMRKNHLDLLILTQSPQKKEIHLFQIIISRQKSYEKTLKELESSPKARLKLMHHSLKSHFQFVHTTSKIASANSPQSQKIDCSSPKKHFLKEATISS